MPDGTTPATRAGISISTLLLQAQQLLNDADEANHGGDYSTFALQRQAREVLAEAIDQLTLADLIAQRNSALATMRTAGADMEAFRRAARAEAQLAVDIRRLKRGDALGVHPYHETQE